MNLYPTFQTTIEPEILREKMRAWQPWGHRIDFSNGVSTTELERRHPFSENTVQKLRIAEKSIPDAFKKGNRVLDVGFNSGYNSITCASEYEMRPTGIDVTERHKEVATFLSEMAEVDCEFLLESAEDFVREDYFDLVLHFGTLYHLPNPLRSLDMTAKSTKSGGYLALETQIYESEKDPNLNYFMHMHNNDKTNFWALSSSTLTRYLELIGYENVKQILNVKIDWLGEGMSRRIYTARKV